MTQWKGFAFAAACFSLSSVALCLGRQFGVAAGMAGIAFLYAALAYRAKSMKNP